MFIRQKIRIYPNKQQKQFLNQNVGNSRFVWNYFLAKNIDKYKTESKFIFYHEMSAGLKTLKEQYPFLSLGNAQALQQTLKDLEQALKMTFKNRQKRFGFPKFKKKSPCGSFRMPQGCSIENQKLFIPKLKTGLKLRNKTIPDQFKSVTILKTATEKYFASFVVEVQEVQTQEVNSTVGIDLNSKFFVVLSTGHALNNPKFLKDKERRLKRYQRILARKQMGSSNRNKARKRVAIQHEKIRFAQENFLHQLTSNLVQTYDHISIEDLNVKAMQKFNGRMIQSAPFGAFRSMLTWKAKKFGKTITVIDRFCPTSKVCSGCGQVLNLTLKDRWIKCDCGLSIHRDHNAAINISRVGTAQSQACGDTRKPRDFLHHSWVSLKQEASPSGGAVHLASRFASSASKSLTSIIFL